MKPPFTFYFTLWIPFLSPKQFLRLYVRMATLQSINYIIKRMHITHVQNSPFPYDIPLWIAFISHYQFPLLCVQSPEL